MSMPISPNYARGSRTMQSPPRMGGQPQQPGGGPVEGALAYGRRKMGLPGDFERGNVASFEDGGVVPDPSAAPPAQPEATDPEAVLKYLSGDGALSPDVIMAMEAMADPDNTMDATDRLDAVLGRAPSPDVAFGVLQHHRTKFNGYTAAAKVASQKGDYTKAAAYANKAHASVPGSRRRFAPGMGGLQMLDAQPQPETQAFSQGGSVDSSNPNDEDEQSYADGGEVDTRYDAMPESDNVDDRRMERGEGWVGKGDGPIPEDIGAGTIARYNQGVDERARDTARDTSSREFDRNSGVVRKKQQAFADGGEVEEDEDVTAAVTPDDGMGGGAEDAPLTTGASEVADDDLTTGATASPTAPAAPAYNAASMLSPEDFDRMMSVPYDTLVKPKEAPKPKDDLLSGRSYGSRIWDLMPNSRTHQTAGGRSVTEKYQPRSRPAPAPTAGAERGPTDWTDPALTGIGQGDQAAPAGGKRQEQMAPDESSHAEKMKDPYREGRQHANERRDEMMQWYEAQSRKLFPWASQEGQRQQFIMHGMERFFGHDLVREGKLLDDKAGIAERGLRQKALDSGETHRIREESNVRNNETRKQIAAFNQTEAGQRFRQGQMASTLRTAMMSGQETGDPKAMEALRKSFEQTTGIKVDPGDHDTIKEILGLNRSMVKAPSLQGSAKEAPLGTIRTDPNTGAAYRKTQKGWEKA